MTSDGKLDCAHLVTSAESLRALYPPTHEMAKTKVLDHIDRHARAFIARSPFLCIGTQSDNGRADVSPRGDPPGFVTVLSEKTLLIPDRPGNNRLDTQCNILANPTVGLLFMIPGYEDTLRVNGMAAITTDPDLLARMAVNGRVPRTAVAVSVTEVFLHCAKAFRRSRLWDPAAQQDRKDMPSLPEIILDQTTGAPEDEEELRRLEADLETEYRNTMY